MAVRTAISAGLVFEMLEDEVYAMPAPLCNSTVQTAGGTIEVSLDESTWQEITPDSNFNFTTSAPYIRVSDDDALIICKAL